jgi:tetratricopeptide (TPR) repeat protein
VVRSSAAAARFATEAPDLKALAADADVDRVVMGTLLRVGDQLRAAAQLVEAPGGTLLTSHTVQTSLGDLFRLQDDIARRVVEALSLPLAGGSGSSPLPALPRHPQAYELYLRANELARHYEKLPEARDLYQRCLELDPGFAAAWAQLGRCHRVIGKFIEQEPSSDARAEEAFRRALELQPRLSVAHKYYAQLEGDLGRSRAALVRLLGEAGRHGNDAELFAGLVHACRYCGLYEQAVAAHGEARRLDPNVPTSFEQTLLMMGDIDRLLAVDPDASRSGGDEGIRVVALGLAGRRDESRRVLEARPRLPILAMESWIAFQMAWIERRPAEMASSLQRLGSLKIVEDPEARFELGWLFCEVGEPEQGLAYLRQAVDRGYFAFPTLSQARAFDPLRGDARFQELLAQAESGRQAALVAFRESDGERLLGRG